MTKVKTSDTKVNLVMLFWSTIHSVRPKIRQMIRKVGIAIQIVFSKRSTFSSCDACLSFGSGIVGSLLSLSRRRM